MPNVVGLAGSGTKPASAGGVADPVGLGDDEHATRAKQKGAATEKRIVPRP
jgi:hypothetical protein